MAEGGTVTYSSKEKLNTEGDQKRITSDGGVSSNTVEVRGLSADTSQEVVEMYFENSRRSGGGDIEEVQIKDGIAYITFVEAETAQRVVSRSSHQVAGQTLTVTLYHPPPIKPCYDNRILVQELNSAVTGEILTNFLETEIGAKVTEILYGEEVGRVVVTFSSCIDFNALRKACSETRIKSMFLQVAKVVISNCILVWNIQLSASRDVILLYFENKRRSGGGEVEKVEMVPEERYCLVYFEDNSVIDRVLSQTHKIDGADVKVHLHHECLGRRSSTDRSHLCFKISNTGDKDTATLNDTPSENSIKVSSDSISSDYDKESDFVEVPDRQINDDTATLDDTSTENSMKETFSSTDISVDYDKTSDFVEVAEWQLNDAKAEEPGLEQRVWSYPNGKKIMLVKATSYDADVIIIPGNSDKDSQSHSGDKNLMRLKVPDGSEMKAKTVLQQEIKEVLDRILEKTVGICIKTMEGWKFLRYLKCFLYEIYKCFIRNEGMPCPIECVILLVDDASDYNNARKIIQKSFKLEQDKSEVFASQRLLLQEQGSVFKRIRVQVQKGQLHEAKIEVLVNTVDRSLDLTKGVISSSLLDKAGNGIQGELQQYQGNFVFGEVLKTGVGTLPKPCKAIFHGVLYVYEEHSDCLKVFQDFILGCLEDANKKYKSVAFPPIGIGKLRYPKYLVALIMFQSVAKFEQAHPKCQLEEVIFVIHEKDEETLKVFEELYRTYVVI